MAQLAYLHEDTGAEGPENADALAPTVTVFADRGHVLKVIEEDIASAGLTLRGAKTLETLRENDSGVLGDVVLVDCPQVDAQGCAALARLDERAFRSGAQVIVSTSVEALDAVFGCMDRSAPQFLVRATRGERLVALGSALAAIPGHRVREMDEGDRVALVRLTEQVGKLAEKLDRMAAPAPMRDDHSSGTTMRIASPTQGFRHAERQENLVRKPKPPLPDPRLVKTIIRQRQMRSEFFADELFADPAWDILLDLTAARAEHRRVSVTSLCIAANVPATTALRWISQMVDTGLLERVQDDSDRRRAFIALSDVAAEAMARYFDALDRRDASIV